jgi:hypothetical protein
MRFKFVFPVFFLISYFEFAFALKYYVLTYCDIDKDTRAVPLLKQVSLLHFFYFPANHHSTIPPQASVMVTIGNRKNTETDKEFTSL